MFPTCDISPDGKRFLIGPTKKKGYYGFFLDKGWRHRTGPRARGPLRRHFL